MAPNGINLPPGYAVLPGREGYGKIVRECILSWTSIEQLRIYPALDRRRPCGSEDADGRGPDGLGQGRFRSLLRRRFGGEAEKRA